MKTSFYVALPALALLLAACGGGRDKTASALPTVRIDTVQSADAHRSLLQFPGRVKAADEVTLSFKVPGVLRRVAVGEGDRVRRGQLLAELDDTDYRVQLQATEAEYNQVKGDAERVMALWADSSTTASAADRARYGLQQITAKRDNHRNQLAYTRLYAPFDGRVQKRFFTGRETVGAGTPVLTLLGEARPEVEINLPAASYIRRDEFRTFTCQLDVFPGRTFALEPLGTLPRANANQLYTMRLQLASTEGAEQPEPGMAAWVSIELQPDSVRSVVTVPATALFREKEYTYLYIYDADTQIVNRRPVTVSRLLSDGRALVESEALRPGTLIVSSGVHSLHEGDKVQPLPRPSETNVGGLL